MGYTIAIAGKGGTGKTTIAALIIRLIKENKLGSLLAVDADPNSNLGEALGVKIGQSIGQIIDEIAEHPEKIPAGMTKDRFVEYQIQTAIQEAEGFDLLSMGKPEGPGCYCYANNLLRNIMAKLIQDYDYVVIDNEAGFEHISRRTTRELDMLLLISDPTKVGLKSAERIKQLAKSLKIKSKKIMLLVNRQKEKPDLAGLDLEYLGSVAVDEEITKISLNGSSLLELKDDVVSISALKKLGKEIWQGN